jgi:N4-gp56 family major capsid protein
MPATDFGSLEKLRVTKYSTYVMMAGRDQSFWLRPDNGFLGKNINDASKPVHYVDQFTKTDKGLKAIIPLVLDLVNDGVVNDNEMEGNEEEMVADYVEIELGMLRNALKSKGRLSDQATVINFRATGKEKLAFWLGDKLDELLFLVASGITLDKKLDGSTRASSSQWTQLAFNSQITAPSSARKLFAGTATSTSGLTASDTMSWSLLLNAKAYCINKKIKPMRINGKPQWGVVMHPYQSRDLKKDSDYKNAVQYGQERGDKNPLFTGAFVNVDNLVLFEHNKVANTFGLTSGVDKWGSGNTVDGAQALLFGSQALGYAMIDEPFWDESDKKDYGNRSGIAYSTMTGFIKSVFKSLTDSSTKQDFAIISIYTACKPI